MSEQAGRMRLGAILFYGVVVLLGYLMFRVFQPFLVPLGWAAVLVVCFHPLHRRFEARFGAARGAAASTVLVTLILIVPCILVMLAFLNEARVAIQAVQKAQQADQWPMSAQVETWWQWIQQHLPAGVEVDPAKVALDYLQRVGTFLAGQAGAILKNVAIFFFDLFVTIFAMFYLFRDSGAMMDVVRRLLPFSEQLREPVIRQAQDLIQASVTSGLIVAAVQGALGGLAFALVGLPAPVFWGVLMGFLSLLPMVGAWLVWLPGAIWLFLSGEPFRGAALVAMGAGLVGTVDNFLRPWLISGRSRLNGLVVFISMLGGISVFGMLGVVLGPIVVATGASLFEVYTRQAAAASDAAMPPAPAEAAVASPTGDGACRAAEPPRTEQGAQGVLE